MKLLESARRPLFVVVITALCAAAAQGQAPAQQEFQPEVGQPGKDVVWVPTPQVTVEKMLDMAQVTSKDFVMDLGSGDGRNIIAAAKRGARGLGVEFNPDMVALSERTAAKEGVADRAKFVQGDMFVADISQATVLALFLLPDNLRTLRPKFEALKPGTRIVANTFGIDGWEPEQTDSASGDCGSWCKTLLYIVPADARGTWRLTNGTLTLQQEAQKISGTLRLDDRVAPIENGRMRGDEISFTSAGVQYSGRVSGTRMELKAGQRTLTAAREN